MGDSIARFLVIFFTSNFSVLSFSLPSLFSHPLFLLPPLLFIRFRQEYRLERKLLAELDVNPETYPVDEEELSALFASSLEASGRHRISRVVVLHNDKLETFLNPDAEVRHNKTPVGDDFFDNDSFWSGSITWY
jgi:hypothetical protein